MYGASKIYMSPSSELGPIDPQTRINGVPVALWSIVESYNDLFNRASMRLRI